jgi:hypothetical protein
MVDITAKRGPRDPSEGLTNQGVATQAMLNSMAREQQYELQKRAKKKSTWDSIVGGIKDVVNIGKGVMDIANSYEDLQVKDEQLKAAEVKRQAQELAIEEHKNKLDQQSIQNELKLKDLQTDNDFVDTFNTYVKENDFEGATSYALSHPKQSQKYQALLLNTADYLDENGDTDTADVLRLSTTSGTRLSQLNSKYGNQNGSGNSKKANSVTANDYNIYKSKMDVLTNEVLHDDNNIATIKDLLGGESKDVAQDLMTCAISMNASNTVNKNLDEKDYANSASLNLDTNLSKPTTDTSGKNIQYLDVTCKVGDEFGTGKIVYDASKRISYPYYNSKGVYVGMADTTVGEAMSDLIAHNKKYLKLIGKGKEYAPAITTRKVLQEQAAIQESNVDSQRPVTESESKGGIRYSNISNKLIEENNDTNEVSKNKVTRTKGKIRLGEKTDAELKREEKLNKKQLDDKINQEIRAVQNNSDVREATLSAFGFSEKQYQQLSAADKYRFLLDLNTAIRNAQKDKDISYEDIKVKLMSKYNIKGN